MRKVQPFTIGTKLSVHSPTPDLHLCRPSVTSQPASSSSVQAEAELREEDTVMKSTCEPLYVLVLLVLLTSWCSSVCIVCVSVCCSPRQEVNLALEVSLFYQRADAILSDLSRTLSQSENTTQCLSETSRHDDDITADITVLDRCAHHLSELHPTLTARVRLKLEEVRTCWALLQRRHSVKLSRPPEALCPQFGHRQKEPGREPPGSSTLDKPPPSESSHHTLTAATEEGESSVTLSHRVSPERFDQPQPSSISVFLNFDPQTEGNQGQLTPPPTHLVNRCVQVTGESSETHHSGDKPSISSSSTTFLPRVSTVVLPPSPSPCSVSTLNLQLLETRTGRGHGHTVTADEDEDRERSGTSHRPPRLPVNTELLLYIQNSSVVTMETENTALRPNITAGGNVTQVRGDDEKLSSDSEDVSDFRFKGNTNSSVIHAETPEQVQCGDVSLTSKDPGTTEEDQAKLPDPLSELVGLALSFDRPTDKDVANLRPKEETSSPITPVTVSSNQHQTGDQQQQADLSPRATRDTFTDDSVTKDGFTPKVDSSHYDEDVSHFEEEARNPVLCGPQPNQDRNQQVNFSCSAIRKTITKNLDTEKAGHHVRPWPHVSSESSSDLHLDERGSGQSLDPPTGGKDTSESTSKKDTSSSGSSVILPNLHVAQDENRDSSPRDVRKVSDQTEESEDRMKPPGVVPEAPSSLLPQEQFDFDGDLSTPQPSGRLEIIQDHRGDKNHLIVHKGPFIQKTDLHLADPEPAYHQHHCLSVHTKTCDLRGHIYQPVTDHVLVPTQPSGSTSLNPGLRWSGRVVDCLAESCCICSPVSKSRQEAECNENTDPLSPGCWLFDEVDEELEDIWKQTEP
ncbi:uncharacterized protein LOC121180534 isoform X2 [Toxotes jaculatrix]|uniref:uncharacterized protein LOC121180534 isoform X2 n=1 Tax=Toxotes jaculatrix TaxID=941984 RepID=UPI001B3B0521|nr:uncharacterized protein LOC121180534 isoform X2 [Toxotes jaculatrix]